MLLNPNIQGTFTDIMFGSASLLLFAFYLVNWLALALVVSLSSKKKSTLRINLIVQVAYSLCCWFVFFNNPTNSWVFLILALVVHLLAIAVQLAVIIWKRYQESI